MKRFNRIVIILLVVSLAALYIGKVVFEKKSRAEHSYVSHGKELAISSGCFACHGHSEDEERLDFRQAKNGKWRKKGIPTIWEDGIDEAAIFTEWIRDGVVEKQIKKHKQFLIQMPAYGKDGILTDVEIESIVSWIMSESIRMNNGGANGTISLPETEGVELTEDQLLVLGDRLSRKNACYQCHGEIGQGGVPNPKSFKGYIPGFYGHEFLELTANGSREELLNWLNKGHGIDIESGVKGKLAKAYIEAQALDMPAYEELLTDQEKDILVDYMLLLNKRGPLDSAQLEAFSKTLIDTKFVAK